MTERNGKHWTEEEDAYLQDSWGTVSIPSMAKRLRRTPCAVKNRATILKLGPHLESGDYVTFNSLLRAMGYPGGYSHQRISFIKKRGLPVHYRKVFGKRKYVVVYMDEFWAWAKEHRNFLDFSKMPKCALGMEPKWVDEQRKRDETMRGSHLWRRWDRWDDIHLRDLVEKGVGCQEISRELGRTPQAIWSRCRKLGLNDPAVIGHIWRRWTDEEKEILTEGLLRGEDFAEIAGKLGRSVHAVRDMMRRTWGTYDADKVVMAMRETG